MPVGADDPDRVCAGQLVEASRQVGHEDRVTVRDRPPSPFQLLAHVENDRMLTPGVGITEVVGADHVALGSDFDGFAQTVDGLEDVSRLPNLTAGLLARGYSRDDIKKILGGNALRVFKAVWRK